MKWCNKCQQWKDKSEFNNHIRCKDGKRGECRKCEKLIRENNREYERERKKKWRKENKEHVEKQKEKYKKHLKQKRKLPISWSEDTKWRQKIGEYEKIRESENGNVEVRCAYCEEWFEPTRLQIEGRLHALNGKLTNGSECRLYCSEDCKQSCPTYQQQTYPKGQKPYEHTEIQKELHDRRIEIDNYTCQNCKTHQDDLEEPLECHHIWPINESPVTSGDVDECKMVCKECHKEIHKKPGCKYNELKCTY